MMGPFSSTKDSKKRKCYEEPVQVNYDGSLTWDELEQEAQALAEEEVILASPPEYHNPPKRRVTPPKIVPNPYARKTPRTPIVFPWETKVVDSPDARRAGNHQQSPAAPIESRGPSNVVDTNPHPIWQNEDEPPVSTTPAPAPAPAQVPEPVPVPVPVPVPQPAPAQVPAPEPAKKVQEYPPIPKLLSSFDHFYATLLRFPLKCYLHAGQSGRKADELWLNMCTTADLERPLIPIQATYSSAKEHFDIRAALVLEETRQELSRDAEARWRKDPKCTRGNRVLPSLTGSDTSIGSSRAVPIKLETNTGLIEIESNSSSSGPKYPWIPTKCRNVNHKEGPGITAVSYNPVYPEDDEGKEMVKRETSNWGYGTIVECDPGADGSPHKVLWGVMKTIRIGNKNKVAINVILFYRDIPFIQRGGDLQWRVRHLGSYIPSFRQFWACTSGKFRRVPFLEDLMGKRQAAKKETPSEKPLANWVGATLNSKQDKVVKNFLRSPDGTLQVVQGPPGCGKTTLLVSLIRNYLANRTNDNKKVLMVCAPTNKAVSVLATRFLSEICPAGEEPDIGITVLGDIEKLSDGLGRHSTLRPYHLYQFLNVIQSEVGRVVDYCDPEIESDETSSNLCHSLRRVQTRLKRRLRYLPKNVDSAVASLCVAMEGYHASSGVSLETVRLAAQDISKLLIRDVGSSYRDDMICSTDVFFCTLLSSGIPSIQSARVDDLVVDEAAAATEPCLYIPLYFRPQRMLVVGDPKQLPAVVNSNLAKELGLSESLHERLMKRCDFDYTLLEEQYRMHPEISAFPSRRFYNEKIADGNNVLCRSYGANANVVVEDKPFIFYNVRGTIKPSGSSLENHEEAKAVVDVVASLSKTSKGQRNWSSVNKLRVITFYKPQRALIQRLLKRKGFNDVEVATVDASQGCEADVVVVSFVRGGSGGAGFLKDDRRINVALTRARHQLICIGDAYGLQKLKEPAARTLRSLAEEAQKRGIIESAPLKTVSRLEGVGTPLH